MAVSKDAASTQIPDKIHVKHVCLPLKGYWTLSKGSSRLRIKINNARMATVSLKSEVFFFCREAARELNGPLMRLEKLAMGDCNQTSLLGTQLDTL